MPRGKPNRKYSGEFKQQVVETMRNEHWSCRATAAYFGIHLRQVQDWERIYLEEGAGMLYVERRGRASKGRPPKLSKQVEEDLIAENQRLRAEVEYLKKLQALVLEEERHQSKKPR